MFIPGQTFIRSWIPSPDAVVNDTDDKLYIYDGGDKQGFLLELASGKREWHLIQVLSREYLENGNIQETGTILLPD